MSIEDACLKVNEKDWQVLTRLSVELSEVSLFGAVANSAVATPCQQVCWPKELLDSLLMSLCIAGVYF